MGNHLVTTPPIGGKLNFDESCTLVEASVVSAWFWCAVDSSSVFFRRLSPPNSLAYMSAVDGWHGYRLR